MLVGEGGKTRERKITKGGAPGDEMRSAEEDAGICGVLYRGRRL